MLLAGLVTRAFLLRKAKNLQRGWCATGGRNSTGRTTSYKKGSFRCKRLYRFVDFWRRVPADAFIIGMKRDNFRTTPLSLVLYRTGVLTYIILPEGYRVGDKVCYTDFVPLFVGETVSSANAIGQAFSLKYISDGATIFNLELWPNKGAQVCRSAGTYAVIINRRGGFVTLKLKSGWTVVVSEDCYATIGMAPNYKHKYRVLRKAGLRVNLGRRPTTRGVAMNAIDHPHGGGRGKTSGGPQPKTPWGLLTKWRKTVSKRVRILKALTRYR